MTSGNHIFDKSEIIPYIEKNQRLIRPANYPPSTPGNGLFVGEIRGFKIAALNLLGRVFMPPVDDPFRAAENCLSSIPDDVKIRIVDMHAEATSEKYAMGWFLAVEFRRLSARTRTFRRRTSEFWKAARLTLPMSV
jgi:calcineurin-like phosphoesterase